MPITIVAGANVLDVQMNASLPEVGSLEGIVTDGASGLPLPGVLITVNGPAVATRTTNSDGWYLFEGLPLGSYTVTFELAGYQTVIY